MGIDFEGIKNKVSDEHVDKAADLAKSKFGEHADKIDTAAEKAKGFLGGESGGRQQESGSAEGGQEPQGGNPEEGNYGR
ncbi:antitoxin [Amycolatopsis sp. NPDC059021]|uniref:antitoxin n=1 Tax=Amycolatopsis sp. NPDC059021 TaxID=3346704 RepID=UPI00366CE7C2